ncbi:MAG: CPBP family intramembrane glutamic endopeptidase [Pirellulales bacterium]
MDDQDDNDYPEIESNDPRQISERFVQTAVIFEGLLVVVAIFLGWVSQTTIWVSPSSDTASLLEIAKAISWGGIATVPMVLLLHFLEHEDNHLFTDLRQLMQSQIVPLFCKASIWELAVIALAAGVGEEALFRGLLQPWFIALIGSGSSPMFGILLASILFGLVHYVTMEYAILATVMGLYFGLLFWMSGDLIVPITVHFLYDWYALVYLRNKYNQNNR